MTRPVSPEATRLRHRPFGIAGACAIVFVALTVGTSVSLVAVVIALLVTMLRAGDTNPTLALATLRDSPFWLPIQAIPTSLSLLVVAVVVTRVYGIRFGRAVAWSRPPVLASACGLVLIALTAIASSTLVQLLREAFPQVTLGVLDGIAGDLTRGGPAHRVAIFVALAVFPPVAEELLFRGVILGSVHARRGATLAVVTSSMLFGLLHLDPPQALNAAILGLALGVVTVRTGSIVPAMLAHFANNALACFAVWWGGTDTTSSASPIAGGVAAVLVVPVGLLLFRLTPAASGARPPPHAAS